MMLVTLGIALQSAPAFAAPPPSASGLPGAVRQYVKDLNYSCGRMGGIPSASPGLVQTADLTDDGRADYIVDVGRYQCEKAVTFMHGGHNGNPVTVFVARSNGTAALAYDGYSHGAELRRSGGRTRLWLTVGALACGQPADRDLPFSDWWFCSRPFEWVPKQGKFVFAPIDQARRIR